MDIRMKFLAAKERARHEVSASLRCGAAEIGRREQHVVPSQTAGERVGNENGKLKDRMKIIGKVSQHGFTHANFLDAYGTPCRLYESSGDTPALWLGLAKVPGKHPVTGEQLPAVMLLDEERVRALVRAFDEWLQTRRLPSIKDG